MQLISADGLPAAIVPYYSEILHDLLLNADTLTGTYWLFVTSSTLLLQPLPMQAMVLPPFTAVAISGTNKYKATIPGTM